MNKRLKIILAGLEDQGCTIKRTTRGFQVLVPGGGIITTHGTPSDRRAEQNFRADVRRAGLTWPL